MKQEIRADKAPQPIGPYSQAILAKGQFLFISGQIPLRPDGSLVDGEIREQTKQAIENIKSILQAAGLSLNDVVKTTVLMKNLADFSLMNETYNEYFSESRPARATFESPRLPKDALIEIEAIAVKED